MSSAAVVIGALRVNSANFEPYCFPFVYIAGNQFPFGDQERSTMRVGWSVSLVNVYMSRGMRFPTMWHFDKCRLIRASAASF